MNSNLKPFTFVGYDQKKKWEVRNDGHSGGSHVGWTGRPNCAVLVIAQAWRWEEPPSF